MIAFPLNFKSFCQNVIIGGVDWSCKYLVYEQITWFSDQKIMNLRIKQLNNFSKMRFQSLKNSSTCQQNNNSETPKIDHFKWFWPERNFINKAVPVSADNVTHGIQFDYPSVFFRYHSYIPDNRSKPKTELGNYRYNIWNILDKKAGGGTDPSHT